jgi:hypothetical protein
MGARDTGWHFSAQNALAQKIKAFSMENMSHKLKEQSPHLWQTLSLMLVSDPTCELQQVQYLQKEVPKEPSEMMVDSKGLKTCSHASQNWEDKDKYWACDANGKPESSKVDDNDNDGDNDGHPTK